MSRDLKQPANPLVELRRVELFSADSNSWRPIAFIQLMRGNIFRLFEPDGEPVVEKNLPGRPPEEEARAFVALADATATNDERSVACVKSVAIPEFAA